ncbi:acyltransferase [Scytonema hofmannii FACHB-248]|uniref:Acyltransferase n=1 Tax=Scytonema hofmannii FACHB-248 TaxID=1842502 RepID=A0ABR8GK64_9CYAN|nr:MULTISPECIES: acyltransferase [Nostocales]MBD2603569.1 acyltransferase [Scytonema hofmannii FACHB-248]
MNKSFSQLLLWLQSKHHWYDKVGINRRIEIKGTNNRVVIASGTKLYNLQIVIHGNDNILSIGKNCIIGGFMEMFGNGNEIIVGSRTQISENVRLVAHGGTRIRIGEGCVIADLTDIRTTDSHSILNAEGDRINPDENIEIGDRVWLTREVMVLKGADIGSDTVIGARSIVTKTIPSNSLAIGIPAKVVRTNITWLVESI